MENPREWARTLAPSTEADDSKRQAVEQRAMTPCSSGEAQGRLAKMESASECLRATHPSRRCPR